MSKTKTRIRPQAQQTILTAKAQESLLPSEITIGKDVQGRHVPDVTQIPLPDGSTLVVPVSRKAVDGLVRALEEGTKPDAIDVINADGHYILAKGHTRLAAHILHHGYETPIAVNIHAGDLRTAKLMSYASNVDHGNRRTRDDEWRTMALLLTDPDLYYDESGAPHSMRQIGEMVKLSHPTVSKMTQRIARVAWSIKSTAPQMVNTPEWLVDLITERIDQVPQEVLNKLPAEPAKSEPVTVPSPSSQQLASEQGRVRVGSSAPTIEQMDQELGDTYADAQPNKSRPESSGERSKPNIEDDPVTVPSPSSQQYASDQGRAREGYPNIEAQLERGREVAQSIGTKRAPEHYTSFPPGTFTHADKGTHFISQMIAVCAICAGGQKVGLLPAQTKQTFLDELQERDWIHEDNLWICPNCTDK